MITRSALAELELDGRHMGIARWLRSLFGQSRSSGDDLVPPEAGTFVYVKIPESLGPIDRGAKYEDAIDAKLRADGLGEVTGGGSQLGDAGPDGVRPIEFCGIDVDATDLQRALRLLRHELVELGAPEGTELHYEDGDVKLQDELSAGGWVLRRPRSFLHPGFGV